MRLPYLAAAVFCDILLFAPTVVANDAGTGSAVWIPSSNNWYVVLCRLVPRCVCSRRS